MWARLSRPGLYHTSLSLRREYTAFGSSAPGAYSLAQAILAVSIVIISRSTGMYQVQQATGFSRGAFFVRWALTTMIAGALGMALFAGITLGLSNAINDAYGWNEGFEGVKGLFIAGSIGLVVLGAVVGYGQSKVLERELSSAGLWTLATALALPISVAVAMLRLP